MDKIGENQKVVLCTDLISNSLLANCTSLFKKGSEIAKFPMKVNKQIEI